MEMDVPGQQFHPAAKFHFIELAWRKTPDCLCGIVHIRSFREYLETVRCYTRSLANAKMPTIVRATDFPTKQSHTATAR